MNRYIVSKEAFWLHSRKAFFLRFKFIFHEYPSIRDAADWSHDQTPESCLIMTIGIPKLWRIFEHLRSFQFLKNRMPHGFDWEWAYLVDNECFHNDTTRQKRNTDRCWYCKDRVSSCNIYAVQQDTQSVSMGKFIQHLC